MMNNDFLKNKEIPESLTNLIEKKIKNDEQPLFAVVSDLNDTGDYGISVVVFFENYLIAVDETGQLDLLIDYCDIDEFFVERRYGSAVMYAKIKDKKVRVMQSTLSIAQIFDRAAHFIHKKQAGVDASNSVLQVKVAMKNSAHYCKHCGSLLPNVNAKCKVCNYKSGNRMLELMVRYVKGNIVLLVASLLISVLTTLASLIPPYIISKLVDTILPNKDLKMLSLVIILLVSAYFVQIGIGALRNYILRIAGVNIVSSLKNDVYEKSQYLTMKFYDKTSTGGVINRINSDTTVFKQFLLTVSQDAIVNLFTMIGIIIVMLVMNWKLALISLIPVPVVVLISRILTAKVRPMYHRLWRRSVRITSALSNTIPTIRVVKAFSAQNRTIADFEEKVESAKVEEKAISKITAFLPALITFMIMCGTALIWFFGGNMVIRTPDALSIGVLVSFISYASMFYTPVNFFATLTDTYQNASTSCERLLDILEADSEPDEAKGKNMIPIKGKIEFRSVNFSFDKAKKVLNNVNVIIEPGDIVGIVGTTGSGKTTMINLLMRFYDDYDGEILLDDINIKDYDLKYYREQIGYVQQDSMLFRDTIFNNIAYARPNASFEEVAHSAEVASAHTFIKRMPDGYDSTVGEHGVGLSGGEKQRISIARAVLKNPSIMIFDEATSAMDSETEKSIQAAIDGIINGRTTLMIAHRLSTLKKANKIIVVDKGKIIEFGTPEELLALEGKYYKLVNMQSMREKAREIRINERFE